MGSQIIKKNYVFFCFRSIVIPGESTLLLSPEYPKPGFQYYGEGFDKGQCGVIIKQVKNINHGSVTCYLGSKGEEHVGTVPLTVARKFHCGCSFKYFFYFNIFFLLIVVPIQPELEVESGSQRGQLEIDEKFTAKCISRDGRPAATLSWFLDDEPLTEGLGPAEIYESLASNNQTLYTSSQTISRYIRATDDRKSLICRATHISKDRPQETRLQMQVRCKFFFVLHNEIICSSEYTKNYLQFVI